MVSSPWVYGLQLLDQDTDDVTSALDHTGGDAARRRLKHRTYLGVDIGLDD
jgi:hypothetical protein